MIKVFIRVADLKKHLQQLKDAGKTIGFVPTMGALHAGHISLMERSKQECDQTISSIFVNPTQFDNKEDLVKYPKTTHSDIDKLDLAGVDMLFLPTVEEMYPNGMEITKTYDFGFVATVGEGAAREGHFEGVAQVVGRLLDIVEPHKIIMGQKDYQQCAVITQLLEFRNDETQIVISPTKREEDGLAMSSRNMRLPAEERKSAVVLSQSLNWIKENFKNHSSDELIAKATEMVNNTPHCQVDYIEIRDQKTLAAITDTNSAENAVALIAVQCGPVRLIDNMLI